MRRKLIQHGRSTLMLSLPAYWLRNKGLNKGDALELTEQDDSVILRPLMHKTTPVLIDGRVLGTMLLRIVAMHYKLGYDHLELILTPEQAKAVQAEMAKLWPGFEIVEVHSNRYVVKDVSGTNNSEFDSIFRKVLHVTTTLADNLYENVASKNYNALQEVLVLEDTINKLSNYCMRLINKWGYPAKPSRSIYVYLSLWKWEKLGDELKFICKKFSSKKPRLGKNSVALLKEAVDYIRACTELFVRYTPELAASLSQKRKELIDKLLKFNGTKDELILAHHLTNIVEFSFNCVGCWLGVVY